LKLLRKLVLALGGLLLGLVLAELGVRLVAPQDLVTENLRYQAHPTLGFHLESNIWVPGRDGGRINSFGLRGEDPGPKGQGEHRVLVLGDSFTYGAGVATEEAFPAVLDELARAAGRERFLNAGTPSYGTLRELAWLEAFGDELEPDEVLLAVFVGNDFTDNTDTSGRRIFDGRMLPAGEDETADWKLRLKVWRYESHLYRLLARRKPKQEPSAPAAPPTVLEELDEAQRAQLAQLDIGFADANRNRLGIYLPEGLSPDVEAMYATMQSALDGALAWCLERELVLSMLIIPDKMQVEQERMELARRRADPEGHYPMLDTERPQRFLSAWCAARDLSCVDVLPAMRAGTRAQADSQPSTEYYYLFNDTHWNVAGHRLAAVELQASRQR